MGTWVINWKKIQTFEDIKTLLISLDLRPVPTTLAFEDIKHLCSYIDDDGKEIPEDSDDEILDEEVEE